MHNSTLLQVPIPDSSDIPDVPTQLAGIVAPLEQRAVIPCTSALRPGSPVAGMTIFETDTKLIRVYDGTRWILPGVGLCTSGTRPGSPYTGMTVFETDTGNTMTYCGASIGWCPPWNTSWGLVPNGSARGTFSAYSSTEVTVLQVTFTSVGHRRYEISAKGDLQSVSGRLLWTVSRITNGANTPLDNAFVNQIAEAFQIGRYPISNLVVDIPAAGSVTYKLRAVCQAGLVMDYLDAQLEVKDIGPSSSIP